MAINFDSATYFEAAGDMATARMYGNLSQCKNTTALRFSGIGVALADAIVTVGSSFAAIGETFCKAGYHICGCPFIREAKLLTGLMHLGVSLPFAVINAAIRIARAVVTIIFIPLGVALNPHETCKEMAQKREEGVLKGTSSPVRLRIKN